MEPFWCVCSPFSRFLFRHFVAGKKMSFYPTILLRTLFFFFEMKRQKKVVRTTGPDSIMSAMERVSARSVEGKSREKTSFFPNNFCYHFPADSIVSDKRKRWPFDRPGQQNGTRWTCSR